MSTKRPISDRPICHACHRPFDPSSPGATLTMGPTCAKRFGLSPLDPDDPQLGLGLDDRAMALIPAPRKAKPVHHLKPAPNSLPKSLQAQYHHAKLAYEAVAREINSTPWLFCGDRAQNLLGDLKLKNCRLHALSDPAFSWPKPPGDLHLLQDLESDQIYHWIFDDGLCSILALDPQKTAEWKKCIATLESFTHAILKHQEAESAHQLSLLNEFTL